MASDPELAAGEQPEPPDEDDDDPDVEEVDPTGRYFRVSVPPPLAVFVLDSRSTSGYFKSVLVRDDQLLRYQFVCLSSRVVNGEVK